MKVRWNEGVNYQTFNIVLNGNETNELAKY